MHNKYTELLRYGVVGLGAVAVDAFVYYILSTWLAVPPEWAKRASFAAGGLWSFLLNKYYTFRLKKKKLSEPVLFMMVYAVGFVLNSIVHDLLLNLTAVRLVAFLGATAVSTLWNYIGQKFIVFRRSRHG